MALGRGSILALVVLAWSIAFQGLAAAQPLATNLEYSVKANYLVRFAAFVEWPRTSFADSRSPVVICVAGRDPFDGVLERAAQTQTAHGRPLTVRWPDTPDLALSVRGG